jgi:hypothetical protein
MDPCIIGQFTKKNPTRCNNVSKFIIPYLCEAQHVSGDTPPIIRILKLHWQPLVFQTWKVVGWVVGGHCQALCLVFQMWEVVGHVVGGCCQAHCV